MEREKDPFGSIDEPKGSTFDKIFQRVVNVVSLFASGMVLVDALGLIELI